MVNFFKDNLKDSDKKVYGPMVYYQKNNEIK